MMYIQLYNVFILFYFKSQEPPLIEKRTRRKMLKSAALIKRISLSCEWNMCTSVFNKVEVFMSHTADHLAAETGTVLCCLVVLLLLLFNCSLTGPQICRKIQKVNLRLELDVQLLNFYLLWEWNDISLYHQILPVMMGTYVTGVSVDLCAATRKSWTGMSSFMHSTPRSKVLELCWWKRFKSR